jgi:hypothetical protein
MNDATVHPLKIRTVFPSRKPGRRGMTVFPTYQRRLPPSRRSHEAGTVEDAKGRTYRVGAGRYGDGKLAEIFINAEGKAGSEIQSHIENQAILISLLLQFGVQPSIIAHSITGVAETALRLFMDDSRLPPDVPGKPEQTLGASETD